MPPISKILSVLVSSIFRYCADLFYYRSINFYVCSFIYSVFFFLLAPYINNRCHIVLFTLALYVFIKTWCIRFKRPFKSCPFSAIVAISSANIKRFIFPLPIFVFRLFLLPVLGIYMPALLLPLIFKFSFRTLFSSLLSLFGFDTEFLKSLLSVIASTV